MVEAILEHNDYNLVLGLAIILLTGLAFGKISKFFKIPNVTGYLLGGLMIGPALIGLFFPGADGLLSEEYIQQLKIVADIELAFIAFTIGTEFKMEYFRQLGPKPIVIAIFESLLAVVFITLAMVIAGFPLPFSLTMGAVGGATAPAATIMVMRQYKARGELSQTILSVVAIDDATGLIFFGFATAIVRVLIGSTEHNLWLSILMPFLEIGLSIIIGMIFGVIITLLMKWFTGRGNRTSLVIAFLFLGIAIARLSSQFLGLGISSLMIAMALGAVYTNTSDTVEKVVPLIERITPPIVIIFFVLSGADLRIESLDWLGIAVVTVYLLSRIFGKVFGAWVGGKISHASPVVNKWIGFGLLPQGGIAIGLSLIAMDLLPESVDPVFNGMLIRIVVIMAVFFSEIFGPLLLKYALLKSGEGTEE